MPTLPPPVSYEEALIREHYPGFAAYFRVSPEISMYLTAAVQQNWSDKKLMAVIRNSDWWKKTPGSAREAINLELTDPASWQQQVSNRADLLRIESTRLGLPLPAHLNGWYAAQGFKQGLTDQQILERMVMEQSPKDPRKAAGVLGDTYYQVKGMSNEWGVPVGDTEAYFVAKHVVSGRGDEAWINDFMKDKALDYYKGNLAIEDAVKNRGMTVRDFAAPYLDMAARELELNPAVIDITNPGYQKAWHGQTENGLGPMDFQQWQKHLRTDPIFGAMHDKTQTAKAEAVNFAGELLTKFGFLG